MMPQKRNPDVAELARAQAGRVLGDVVALATVLKGLPLAYDRDLQEDKPAVFDAHDSLLPAVEAMAAMVRGLRFDASRMSEVAADGDLLATDLAERLVTGGVPFRDAHARVAGLVRDLEAQGRTLTDASREELRALGDGIGGTELTATPSIGARGGGGPSPASVRDQLRALRARLDAPGIVAGAASHPRALKG
jgi:argininosuccinate lyase